MEPQQQQTQISQQEDISNGGGKISTSSYLCRQSSTRWTPTTEQIKLLKELYYINGVRSPSADQIQTICARLRRYGKIEGKNVFYWFQNHKARERQKKRLTPNPNNPPPAGGAPQYHNNNTMIRNGGLHWKQDQDFPVQNKYPSFNNHGVSCSSSSAGVVSGGGQLVGSFGYGAVNMENKFRDCSISGGGVLNGGNANQNIQWTAGNYNPYAPATYSNFLDKISAADDDHDQDHDGSPEIETLPLFPMRNDDNHEYDNNLSQAGFYTIKPGSDGYYTGGYRWSNGNNGNASLELSLNSYGYGCCYSPNL